MLLNIRNVVTNISHLERNTMKKHLIAAATLATLSTAAFAQNVTMYGFIDLGLFHSNNANANGQSVTKMSQAGGNFFPSMYGFTGTEDLGGGMKASFNLQGSMDPARGLGGTGVGNGLFDRYSSVTLSGAAGSVELGRQIDLLFLQSFVNGALPTHSYSLAVNGVLGYGQPTTTTSSTVFGTRISNAVTYTTPTLSGLTAKVMLGKGEVAGQQSGDNLYATVVTYNAGALNLSAGYQSQNVAGVSNAYDKSLVGAKYTVGNTTFAAQYHAYNAKDNSIDTKAFEIGVAHKIGKTTLALNHENYDDNFSGTKPKVTSVKAKYDLSKRTYLYGMAARYNGAASEKLFQGYVAVTAAEAKSANNYAVGIVHGF
jgi:predicted porin